MTGIITLYSTYYYSKDGKTLDLPTVLLRTEKFNMADPYKDGHIHDPKYAETKGHLFSLSYSLLGPGTIVKSKKGEFIHPSDESLVVLKENVDNPVYHSPPSKDSGDRLVLLVMVSVAM